MDGIVKINDIKLYEVNRQVCVKSDRLSSAEGTITLCFFTPGYDRLVWVTRQGTVSASQTTNQCIYNENQYN